MSHPHHRRRGLRVVAPIAASLLVGLALIAPPGGAVRTAAADLAPADAESAAAPATAAVRAYAAARATSAAITGAVVSDSLDDLGDLLAPLTGDAGLYGHSGKLRALFVAPERAGRVPVLARLFGDSAARHPGIYEPRDAAAADRAYQLVTLVPFSDKRAGRIGTYRIGSWPFERGGTRAAGYDGIDGFIRVTPANRDTYVSEHFRLRDFLTKDQGAVWPKYLVLRGALLDKLELVIQELEQTGTPVRHVSVMSGFRTPQYNANGGNTVGRATLSRHMYGDAADVFVDNDRDGRLDDLNGDGRVDTRDVQVMLAAIERVERRYPDLVGGAGVYKATSAHGPFVHVDVRGSAARW